MADNITRMANEMVQDGGAVSVIRMMTEGGPVSIPGDSMAGNLDRPIAKGWPGARTATLETLFDYFLNNVPDPDSAMAQDPNFDEKIRQQPDVHAAMRKRELTVASLPLTVQPSMAPGVDKIEAQKMADYVKERLDALPNINDLYRQMQTAVLDGGHGHEFTWVRNSEGVDVPVAFYPMHKSRFVFDRLGNMSILTREFPVWGAYVGVAPVKMGSEEFAFLCPPGRFIYHKYMAEGGPWFRPASEGYVYWGRGENPGLYVHVTFDMFVVRFRMKWLEKHGMPFTCLYYTEGLASPSQVRQIAESIRGESIALIPRQSGPQGKEGFYSLDFIQPPSIGHDAFASFSETWTKPAVDKILLGGVQAMEIGDVGGYSATMDQRDSGESIIFRYDAMNIDTTMNQQLIPHIVRAVPQWRNVPNAHLPRHCLTPEREKNRLEQLQLLQATAMLVPVRESDVYDASGLQRPKDGSDGSEPDRTVFLGQPQMDQFGGLQGPGDQDMATRDQQAALQQQSEDAKGGQVEEQARGATRIDPRASLAQTTGKLAGRRKDAKKKGK